MTNSGSNSPVIGVSSWAVHDELGSPPIYGAEKGENIPHFTVDSAQLSLLELPAELARRGFEAMHLCHFHLPSRDNGYLAELRSAIHSAGISLHALLADDGDITHPSHGARDEQWIAGWIPIAAQLGVQNMRVIAGKTVRDGALEHSARVLLSMVELAEAHGMGILIENWFDVLSTPAAVYELLERCEGKPKLLLDYGNWSGDTRFEDLTAIAPLATSCHAKATFIDDDHIDEDEYLRCLALPYPTGFSGPYILVKGGLTGIGVLRDFIKRA